MSKDIETSKISKNRRHELKVDKKTNLNSNETEP